MPIMSHLAGGVTGYFKSYRAKSYGDVVANASKHMDRDAVGKISRDKVEALRTKLADNENLTPKQAAFKVAMKRKQHAVGDAAENAFGVYGAATSIVGGTMGYATKELAKTVFTKTGRQGVKDAVSHKASVTGVGAAAGGEAISAIASNADAVVNVAQTAGRAVGLVADAAVVAGNMGVGDALRTVANNVNMHQDVLRMPGAVKGFAEDIISPVTAPIGRAAQKLGSTAAGQAVKDGVEYGGQRLSHAVQYADDSVTKASTGFGQAVTEATGITSPGSAMKQGARWAGGGIAEHGKDMGKEIWSGAKLFHANRNSRGVTLAALGGTLALAPMAYSGGEQEAKYQHKLQQMAGSMSVSNDGGGTFLRDNHAPQVQDMGATGDLVFALHSLRGGG